MTPLPLLYGRENQLPIDLDTDQVVPTKPTDPRTYLANARRRLKEAYAKVNETQKKQQARYKKNYDRKTTDFEFSVGDRVWLNNKACKVGLSLKWTPKWLGPYTIFERVDPVDYVIRADDKRNQLVVQRLGNKLGKYCDQKLGSCMGSSGQLIAAGNCWYLGLSTR